MEALSLAEFFVYGKIYSAPSQQVRVLPTKLILRTAGVNSEHNVLIQLPICLLLSI